MKQHGADQKARRKRSAWYRVVANKLYKMWLRLQKLLGKLVEMIVFYLVLVALRQLIDLEVVEIVIDLVEVLAAQ